MIVAFQGERGAYSEAAALQISSDVETMPCRTFGDVIATVTTGKADLGVLPVYNSIAGVVSEGEAASESAGVTLVERIVLPVRHCLLAQMGATVESIVRARSHPVALAQCRKFFAAHADITAVEWYDTAGAARDLAASPEPGTAAIASARAAEQYGLAVLMENVQDTDDNETHFVVIRRTN